MERMEVEDGELARARSGDHEAFRTLVDRHGRAVFALAFRITGNAHDAEDVVQETFVKAWRRLDEFEARSKFSSWIHRIAANAAYDLLRSRRRRHEDPLGTEGDDARPLASDTPSADRIVFGREVDSRVRAALHRLGPLERSSFLLRHVDGMSMREIADALGSDPNAVKQSVCRAVKKMREALRPALAGSHP
jgi:RNA polymerase sigma-70 factor (ECF subfamily)